MSTYDDLKAIAYIEQAIREGRDPAGGPFVFPGTPTSDIRKFIDRNGHESYRDEIAKAKIRINPSNDRDLDVRNYQDRLRRREREYEDEQEKIKRNQYQSSQSFPATYNSISNPAHTDELCKQIIRDLEKSLSSYDSSHGFEFIASSLEAINSALKISKTPTWFESELLLLKTKFNDIAKDAAKIDEVCKQVIQELEKTLSGNYSSADWEKLNTGLKTISEALQISGNPTWFRNKLQELESKFHHRKFAKISIDIKHKSSEPLSDNEIKLLTNAPDESKNRCTMNPNYFKKKFWM